MTLRNTVIAFFLILAAIVVTRTGAGDRSRTASGGGGGGASAVVCSVSPQRPVEKGGRIVAAAQFRCDSPGPDGLTVTVHLQRNDGGTWSTLAKETFVSNSVYTTREQSAAARTRQVGAACAAGTFRTRVEASVFHNRRSTGQSANSGERRNPC